MLPLHTAFFQQKIQEDKKRAKERQLALEKLYAVEDSIEQTFLSEDKELPTRSKDLRESRMHLLTALSQLARVSNGDLGITKRLKSELESVETQIKCHLKRLEKLEKEEGARGARYRASNLYKKRNHYLDVVISGVSMKPEPPKPPVYGSINTD